MVANGTLVWSDPWVSGAGRVGMRITTPTPTSAQSSVIATVECWLRNAAGADSFASWMAMEGTSQVWYPSGSAEGGDFGHYTAPSSPDPVDWLVATFPINVPVKYAHETQGAAYGQAFVSNDLADGDVVSINTSWSVPVRPYNTPTDPSGVSVGRTSDTAQVIKWTNNVATDRPYSSITVERQTDSTTSTWVVLSSAVSGSATSYTDSGTSSNHRYRYRIKATNSAGTTAYATTDWISTTPSVPSGQAAVKSGSNAVVSWTNAAPYRTGSQVQRSENGGTYGALTDVASTATSWTHSAPATTSTWRYQIRHVITAVPLASGGTTTLYSGWVTTGLLVAIPAAPTGMTATRSSDSLINLSWTNTNPNSSTNPYSGVEVFRQANEEATAAEVKDLGVVASTTDTALRTNSRYRYYARAKNSGGYSANTSTTAWVYTTPAAPTTVGAVKSGTTVVVSWTNAAPYRTGTEVYHSENGGAYSLLTTAAVAATSYTHTGADPAKTHQYRLRHIVGSLASAYATSGVVSLLAAPLAPTVSLITLTTATQALTVSWVHNAVDTTAQSGAQVQYRIGGASWSTATVTTPSSYTFAANTFSNGNTLEVQVRTKGEHASYGPWSASKYVVLSTPPVASITSPSSTTFTASELTATWSYYDAESTAQSGWELQLLDSSLTVVHSASGSGSTSSYWVPVALVDGSSYTVKVRACDGSGQWSGWASMAFSVDYAEPPAPLVSAEFDPASGVVRLEITNPAPTAGQATPDYQDVWIDDALVFANMPISGAGGPVAVVDTIPAIERDVTYTVVARTYAHGSMASLPCTVRTTSGEESWIFLNAGPDFETVAKLKANPATTQVSGRDKVLHTFAGRSKPLEFIGTARTKVLRVSGAVAAFSTRTGELGTWGAFESIADMPAPVCYRDPLGRRLFCSISEVEIAHDSTTDLAKVSLTLTEVDFRG